MLALERKSCNSGRRIWQVPMFGRPVLARVTSYNKQNMYTCRPPLSVVNVSRSVTASSQRRHADCTGIFEKKDKNTKTKRKRLQKHNEPPHSMQVFSTLPSPCDNSKGRTLATMSGQYPSQCHDSRHARRTVKVHVECRPNAFPRLWTSTHDPC